MLAFGDYCNNNDCIWIAWNIKETLILIKAICIITHPNQNQE
jgi:hypothetical protein